jgi:hypothetical protein
VNPSAPRRDGAGSGGEYDKEGAVKDEDEGGGGGRGGALGGRKRRWKRQRRGTRWVSRANVLLLAKID